MMRKLMKYFLGLAAIGTLIGILYVYFSGKNGCGCHCQDPDGQPEEEDFDLDSDLEPVSHREYVPLTPKDEPEEAAEKEAKAPEKAEKTKD